MNAIISAMSKDAILMNNTIKLMELNTITLAKMKDYIIKNIETVRNDANITPDIEENILDGGSGGSVSSGGSGDGGSGGSVSSGINARISNGGSVSDIGNITGLSIY
jgi:uncharacterized membrane protein YgcG